MGLLKTSLINHWEMPIRRSENLGPFLCLSEEFNTYSLRSKVLLTQENKIKHRCILTWIWTPRTYHVQESPWYMVGFVHTNVLGEPTTTLWIWFSVMHVYHGPHFIFKLRNLLMCYFLINLLKLLIIVQPPILYVPFVIMYWSILI